MPCFSSLPGVLISIATAVLLAACSGFGGGSDETYDGLVRVPDTDFREVYLRPGAEFAGYAAYGLKDCSVAFRKNWLRDQNSTRVDLSNRVTQKDVDRIKDALSAACDKHFRAALEQAPAYPLVDSFDNGEAVLVLQPSIINLDISAPDIMTSGITRSYTTDAGEMTLLLEGRDGTTGEILFRVVDRQRSLETMRLRWTNSVTNQAEASRILRLWAGKLRKGLDQITAADNNPG